jgi:hypothetical protein
MSIKLAAFWVVLGLIWYLSINYRQLIPKYRDLYRDVHSLELKGENYVVEHFQTRSEQPGNRGSIPGMDNGFSSTPIRSDQLGAP